MKRFLSIAWLLTIQVAIIYCAVHSNTWMKSNPDVKGILALISDFVLVMEVVLLTLSSIAHLRYELFEIFLN